MADKDLVLKEKLEHSGLFDFRSLYSFAHSWFKDERYGVDEEKYSEKIVGNKRNIDIEWKVTKSISDYFKLEHRVKFLITDLTDVEVEIDGEKKKMNTGKISIEIKGTLIRDPNSKWEATPFYRFIREIYNKYVIPSRIDATKDLVKDDLIKFKEDMKAFLELLGRR